MQLFQDYSPHQEDSRVRFLLVDEIAWSPLTADQELKPRYVIQLFGTGN